MRIYTSTKKIPGLERLSLTDRMSLLEQASNRIPIPQKTVLNILKLFVIVPVFVLLLRVSDDWWSLAWAALILLLYPLVVKPLQYSMSVPYLPKKIRQSAEESDEDDDV